MYKMKNCNTAICKYFCDVLYSIKDKEIKNNIIRKNGFYITKNTIENDEYIIVETGKSSFRKKKSIEIISSYDLDDSNTSSIYIFEDKIIFSENGSSFDIKSKEDVFNLSISNNLYFSFDEINFIQKLFKKVIKKRNIDTISFYYTKGEEKDYGYK